MFDSALCPHAEETGEREFSLGVAFFSFFFWCPAGTFCSNMSLLATHFRSAATEREAKSHSRIYSQPRWERWNIGVTSRPSAAVKTSSSTLRRGRCTKSPKVTKTPNLKANFIRLDGNFHGMRRWSHFLFLHHFREMAVEKMNNFLPAIHLLTASQALDRRQAALDIYSWTPS